MKIKSILLQNFASYSDLEFDFKNQGLTLIQGPTGSGKSTLCDAVPWVLFGITAKNGKADEIRPWKSVGHTFGSIIIDNYEITRLRGPNDLYIVDLTSLPHTPIRGKDMSDTQGMINSILKITPELYLSGAYFHEFSQTAQFFSTTAKSRRELCEQIVDLTLAKTLQDSIKTKQKEVSAYLFQNETEEKTIRSNLYMLERLQAQEKSKARDWDSKHEKTIEYITRAAEKFEATRTKNISKECPTCHTVLEHAHTITDTSTNPYIRQIEDLVAEINPYDGNVRDFSSEMNVKKEELIDLENSKEDLTIKANDLDLLKDATEIFRSALINTTVNYIQDTTNQLLTDHFDAEINTTFTATNADKLEVEIHKDGNICSFTQLSKGQRQLLKLCFGVSVMKAVSNHHGVQFNTIFFDEALDGLDDTFKVKAYKLLEELSLSYDNVLVVEHNESLKAMFPNAYQTRLVNGQSQIQKV